MCLKVYLTHYNTCLSHFKEFLKWKFSISDIEITEIDHSFIADFEFFLRTQKSCTNNSAVKYIKSFGKLDEVGLDRLSSKNFSIERIDQVRDIFLFSCYTGLAYIDTRNLKKSNVGMGIYGNKWIFTSRQKPRKMSNIPLFPQVEAIVEKYKSSLLLG